MSELERIKSAEIRQMVQEAMDNNVAETVKRTVEESMAVFLDQLNANRVEPKRNPGLKDSQICGWFQNETDELITGFSIKPEDTVLDIGCGNGAHLSFCAKRGAALICVDQNADVLKEARATLENTIARSIEYHVSDGHPLPLEDGVANRVICNEVLEHVDDPISFIKEVARVGCSGAKFMIGVPDPSSEKVFKELAWPGYFEKPNHVRIFERDQFDELVRSAGLIIERKQYYGFYWSMWWFLFWGLEGENLGEDEPLLRSWANTWDLLLKSEGGKKVKTALDKVAPKSQIVVARKP